MPTGERVSPCNYFRGNALPTPKAYGESRWVGLRCLCSPSGTRLLISLTAVGTALESPKKLFSLEGTSHVYRVQKCID